MRIYILIVYPNEHKWREHGYTLGYFTSKAALKRAVKKNQKALGVYNLARTFHAIDYYPYDAGEYMYKGYVEVVDANVWDDSPWEDEDY